MYEIKALIKTPFEYNSFSQQLRVYCLSPGIADVKRRHYHVCRKIFRQHFNKLFYFAFWGGILHSSITFTPADYLNMKIYML